MGNRDEIKGDKRIKEKIKENKRRESKGGIREESRGGIRGGIEGSEFLTIRESIILLPFILFSIVPPIFKYSIEYVWAKIAAAYLCILPAFIIAGYIWIKDKKITFNFPKTGIPLLLILILGILSAFWAENPHKTRMIAVMIAPGILAYIATQILMPYKKEQLVVLAFASSVAATYVSFYGTLQKISGPCDSPEVLFKNICMPRDQYGAPTPISTFGLANFAVEYLILVFPVLIYFSFVMKNILIKGFFIFSSFVTGLFIILAWNRAGWVGFFITIFFGILIQVMRYLREKNMEVLRKTILSTSILFIVFVVFILITPFGENFRNRLKSFVQVGPGSSVSTRITAWAGGVRMIKDHFLLGVGGGNFEIFSWKYAPRFLDENTIVTNTRVDKAHNEYIQIFADLGIIGFFIFLIIIFTTFKLYYQIFRFTNDKDIFYISTGLFLGILATLAASSFNFALQWPGSVTIFWYHIGLLELIASKVLDEKPVEIPAKGILPILASGGLSLLAIGFPCYEGIPICKGQIFSSKTSQKSCPYLRFLCLVSPGFFSARNLMYGEIYYRMGQVMKRYRRWDESLAYYYASLKYDNPAERTYYDLAYLFLGKDGDKAIGTTIMLLDEALKYVPYFGKGRRELGRFLIQVGQIDRGIKESLESIDSNPANASEAYLNASIGYMLKKDYDKAIEYAQKALGDIENFEVVKWGDKTMYQKIVDIPSVKFQAYHILGTVYGEKGDYEKSITYYSLALSIKDDTRTKINLATAYLNRGEYSKAISIIEGISPANDDERKAKIFNLASAYSAAGDYKKSLSYLSTLYDEHFFDRAAADKYLKKLKEEKIKDNLTEEEKIALAKIFIAKGDFLSAEKILKVLKSDDAKYELARVYVGKGMMSEAKKILENLPKDYQEMATRDRFLSQLK